MNKQNAIKLAERMGLILEERRHGVDLFTCSGESLIKHFSDRDEAIPVDMWEKVLVFLRGDEFKKITYSYDNFESM